MGGNTGAWLDVMDGLDLDEDAQRHACIVLAGTALTLTGGDLEAARGPLCEVLTAVGVIPYDRGGRQTAWGMKPVHGAASSEEGTG